MNNTRIKKIGGQWFMHTESDEVKQVTDEWVKIHYPNLAKSDALHQTIEYVQKKIKTKNITPGVGKTLLAKLKEVLKDG